MGEEHLGLLITTSTDMRFCQPKYNVVIGDYHIDTLLLIQHDKYFYKFTRTEIKKKTDNNHHKSLKKYITREVED